ncbi:Ankyrin repeat [Cohnella sp. OV330]|uniref:ankyrin repeat domain-containing protein n=1 Tax=Cohnella sp. OV330 TaxID=1855288 RepID=UPI0008F38771|nr:ankyrin repeat domain-containing protein [Cohnella sp. OV330]SFB06243.1 Ankyrin repeat [Cohnella sp. OV330]
MNEQDYARFVPKRPDGTVLSFLVLREVLVNNKLDIAFDILERYRFDDLNDERYPILDAVGAYGNKTLFQKLISLGADINKSDAVSIALGYKNFEGVRDLLDLGFIMNPVPAGIALREAACEGELEMVRLYIEYGANVNFNGADSVFPYCTTPVQMAASGNHFEVVKYLVEHGADVTIKDNYGGRAYLEAKRNKNTEMMEYLKQLEPPIWHEADKRAAELKKIGLPTEIIKWLGIENRKIDLTGTSPIDYIEFQTIFDVKPIQHQGRVLLDLTKDVQGFESTGFIIWIPDLKCLGSFDVEHQELYTFKGVKWNKFIKKLPIVIDHLLDSAPINELYT